MFRCPAEILQDEKRRPRTEFCPRTADRLSITLPLKEVSVLLEALEKRQLALETENKQLREDLAGAATMIEEADAVRLMLEQRLLEKDAEIG